MSHVAAVMAMGVGCYLSRQAGKSHSGLEALLDRGEGLAVKFNEELRRQLALPPATKVGLGGIGAGV